jgi:putative zinc finger/helix-turn-helix YgiT family protein
MNHEIQHRRRRSNECSQCGSFDVEVKHFSDEIEYKGIRLDAEGLVTTLCRSCRHSWETQGQEQDNLALLREMYVAKRDAIREADGLLTGEQIEYVLRRLNISKAQAAVLFGGGPNAFGKYLSGEVLQSFAMDRLLRLTLAFGQRAVGLLRLGRDLPLELNCGGIFVAPKSYESDAGMSSATLVINDQKFVDVSKSMKAVVLQ